MRKYLHQFKIFLLCFLCIIHFSFSEDFVAPIFNSSSVINNTTGTEFTLRVNVDQASVVFYVVNTSDTDPTTTEIKAGQVGGGGAAPISGSFLVTDDSDIDEVITGLVAGTDYVINFFAENGDEEQSSVQEISVTATDSTPPVINSSSIINITDVQFTLRTNISENAAVYYVVTSSSTAPSSAQIEAGDDENDDDALFSGSALATEGVNLDQIISGLSPTTEYHVHFFAKDASGNESTVDSESTSTVVGVPTSGSFTSTTCIDDGIVTFSAPASGLGFTYLVFVKPSSAITIGTPTQDPTTYAAPTTDLSNTTPAYENDADARLVYRGNSVPASINLAGLATNTGWTTFYVAIFNVKDNTTYSAPLTFSGSRATSSTIGTIDNYTASPLNQSAQLSFDFPSTCFDQVMIVARSGSAPTMATPGSTSYTADPDFTGSGSTLNSGKVVYYAGDTPGANESFTVTGLTNGTSYHFRYFVRKGSVWFVGTSINVTPDVAPVITNLNPADNSTLMSLSFTNAIITFDVNVEAGSGGGSSGDNRRSARLYRASDDSLIEEIDRNSINFSGQTVTIPFNETLTDNTSYYIQIGPNTIRKQGSTAFPGINDKTTWNFNVILLQANAGPDRTICEGESTTLLGSATGGTGFNSYLWSPSTGLSCTTCPNPTASPASTTVYTLTVDNNAGQGPVSDLVTVTVHPKPDVSFDPGTKTSFIVNEAPYPLSAIADPPDGTGIFSGTGVTLHGDGSYYFNPASAGAQNDIPITYTHTNTNGCSNSVTIEVDVSSESPILNLKSAYCSNESIDNSPSGVLAPNPAVINPTTYRYMRFLDGNLLEVSEADPNYPLIEVTATPKTYRFDPIKASNILVGEVFYIGVYGEFLLFGTPLVLRINTVEVRLNRPGIRPVILSIPAGEICNSSDPVTLQASTDNDGYTSIDYRAFDGATPVSPNPISEPSPGEFVYDPGAITYPNNEVYKVITIYYDYLDKNGCSGTVSKSFFNDRKPIKPTGNDATYCQFYSDPLYLSADSEFGNLRWYDNINLSGTALGFGTVFNTGLSSLSPTTNTFYVVDGNFSCTSDVETVNIQVTPVPNFDLNFPPQCEGKASLYEGPTSNVLSYQWSMGTGDTYSTQSFEYAYTTAGVYDLTLDIVYNSNGQECTARETTTITVGRNPVPNFSFSQVCDGDFTEFTGTSVNNEAEKFAWDFGDGQILEAENNLFAIPDNTHSGNTIGTYQNPHHKFGNSGTYQVTATGVSNLGCSTSITKEITILDIVGSPYDMSTIEGGMGGWRIDTESTNPSWEFAVPNKNIIHTTIPAWITSPNGNYNINERSYVNSPCISINIPRPAIVIDYFCNTPERVDGAVLEYSSDGGVTWHTIDLGTGQLGTGLNWFNTLGFFLGNVGASSIGWSGDLWASPTEPEPFLTGRHSLDNVAGLGNVRFRIAFASGTGDKSQFDGFAFKNIKIESRNRNLLIENFSQESFETNNNAFTNIPSTEGTKLQYHIGFPGTDNIYSENKSDPSARAAYYGITSSSGLVPRAYIDGYSNGNFTGSWQTLYRGLRSLAPSPVEIVITTHPQTNNDELLFEVNVLPATPTSEIPAGTKPVLHAVIVEREVGTNKFVVRKMIPNAAGRPLTVPVNAPITESYTWKPESPNFNPNQIAIVAFIQDEVTKEVYQAAELLNPDINHIPVPDVITSMEDPTFFDGISIYPNPANREFNVVLPEQTPTPIALNLIDAQGRTVHTNGFATGEQQKTIDTSELAPGLYIIQLNTGQGVVRKKVMVVHEK